jgi:hypothetical protein
MHRFRKQLIFASIVSCDRFLPVGNSIPERQIHLSGKFEHVWCSPHSPHSAKLNAQVLPCAQLVLRACRRSFNQRCDLPEVRAATTFTPGVGNLTNGERGKIDSPVTNNKLMLGAIIRACEVDGAVAAKIEFILESSVGCVGSATSSAIRKFRLVFV